MPDYSKCRGDGCAAKDFCLRHVAPPSEWQAWLSEVPGRDEYCEWYIPTGKGAPQPEISDVTFRALTIIRDAKAISPGDFAEKMWPESDGWDRVSKCGAYGSRRGGGMCLAGGGLLGRLRKRGLVARTGDCLRYQITAKGRRALHYTVENRQYDE